jgi:single-strand DNA-binding protein
MHTVTSKLNKDAREHPSDKGTTFFISLGEQSYNYRTKQKEWANYDAALFAKDNQIQYYRDKLKAGAIVTVGCTSLLIMIDEGGNYPPKLSMQDPKLKFVESLAVPMPDNVRQEVYQQPQQAPQQSYQQQPAPQQDNFDDDIPF